MSTDVQEPDLSEEELAKAIAEEKARLEDLLCSQRAKMIEANYALIQSANETKELKKAADVIQSAVNETVNRLSDVLEGKWAPAKPDPQKELPFNDGDISPALWRSEPVTALGLSDSLNAKLDQEGFPTLGVIADEIEMYDPPFGSTEIGPGQVKKIVAAFRDFQAKLESGKPVETPEAEQESGGQ